MRAPSIPVIDYLTLLASAGVTHSKEYALVNQDVKAGIVYFRSPERALAFKRLLVASEVGLPPESEFYGRKITQIRWREENKGVSFEMIESKTENFRGPDRDGYYTGRCPSCALKGRDKDSDHFRFNPEDAVIYCFSGCSKFHIIKAIKGESNDN